MKNKEIIGIYECGKYNVEFREDDSCMGGSETWLKFIALNLEHLGFKVHIFANAPTHNWTKNITIYSKDEIKDIAERIEYKEFIWSRGIKDFKLIHASKKAVILHDTFLTNFGEDKYLSQLTDIFVLSEYSKNLFLKMYGDKFKDKIRITFNGVDQDLYKNKNIKKENSMVWSSCWHRGLIFFSQKVLPIILKSVPDFKLKVCSYCRNHRFDKFLNNKAIIDLGRLSKEELAKEQMKAAIWCYPNLGYTDFGDGKHAPFMETFCITAVENALAGNVIITSEKGGLKTTCNGIKFLPNLFYDKNDRITDEKWYAKFVANLCVKALKGNFKNNFNAEKYTWLNAAKSLL